MRVHSKKGSTMDELDKKLNTRSSLQFSARMNVHLKAALSKCGETYFSNSIQSQVYYEMRSPVLVNTNYMIKTMTAATIEEECK